MTVRQVFYVGSPHEVRHHAAPLMDRLPLTTIEADAVLQAARPGDVCVFFNEHFERFRAVIGPLRERGCPTLLAIDGILEWRNLWNAPYETWSACEWGWRPVLCDKVAAIGPSQARMLESWGNLGKVEVVGIPRLDADVTGFRRLCDTFSSRDGNRVASGPGVPPKPQSSQPSNKPFRLLIMTAKAVGFTDAQREVTLRSLTAIRDHLDRHRTVGDRPVEATWRVTQNLEKQLGIENKLGDTTGQALRTALAACDAVITTPSTAMLEAMLADRPVALLDFHNTPDYVPAAWKISTTEQIGPTLAELANPPVSRRLFQDTVLSDSLQIQESATDRFVRLIERMGETAAQHQAANVGRAGSPDGAITWPARLLDDRREPASPEPRFNLAALYPGHPDFAEPERMAAQAELAHLRREYVRLRRLARWSVLRLWPRQGPPP